MSNIAAYNSDKVKLQESITRIYNKIQNPVDDTFQYDSINDETKRLADRQQIIFRVVSTIAAIAIIITIQRIPK